MRFHPFGWLRLGWVGEVTKEFLEGSRKIVEDPLLDRSCQPSTTNSKAELIKKVSEGSIAIRFIKVCTKCILSSNSTAVTDRVQHVDDIGSRSGQWRSLIFAAFF